MAVSIMKLRGCTADLTVYLHQPHRRSYSQRPLDWQPHSLVLCSGVIALALCLGVIALALHSGVIALVLRSGVIALAQD